MPNITDLFSKAADDSKSYPVVATVTETREAGGKTLKLDTLAGWNTTTPVHFMSYSKKDGVIDLASQSDWKGLVVDNTITQLTLTRGVDNGHAVGDQIVLNPTVGWLHDLISGLGVTLNPDGTLKDGIVKTQNIDSDSFDIGEYFRSYTSTEQNASHTQNDYLAFADVVQSPAAFIEVVNNTTLKFKKAGSYAISVRVHIGTVSGRCMLQPSGMPFGSHIMEFPSSNSHKIVTGLAKTNVNQEMRVYYWNPSGFDIPVKEVDVRIVRMSSRGGDTTPIIEQLTYMQEVILWDFDTLAASMELERIYTLIDKRDGTPYKIALLKDDNVWMVEEFKGKGFTCHPNDSNVSEDYMLPESSLSNFKGTTPALYESNEGYVFYNTYCALAEGKGDIAPLGWEMPPQTYWDNFISKNTNYFESPINIVRKGLVQAGVSSDGYYYYPWHVSSQTESDGFYWSSTPHSTNNEVQLGLWVRGSNNTLSASNNFSNKNYGALLRFVLKRSSNL